jgi:hypothetical protein
MADRSWQEDPGSVEDWSPIKQRYEWFPLLRATSGLIGIGGGASWLWTWMALTSDVTLLWMSPPMIITGTGLALVGTWRRFRELRSPDVPNTRHYWLLLVGWALIFGGMVTPFYLVA